MEIGGKAISHYELALCITNSEDLFDRLFPVVENRFQLLPNYEGVNEVTDRTERKRVMNRVCHFYTTLY